MQKPQHNGMRWLLAVMMCLLMGGVGLFSHATGYVAGSAPRGDTTDTTHNGDTIVIPPDTTDSIKPDTIDTIISPVSDILNDSLLLYIPDSGTFKIPATFKVTDAKLHYAQVGNDTVAAIDPAVIGWVMIPDTVILDSVPYAVTGVGANAFRGCTGITMLDLPDIVEYVGDYAFYADTSLMRIVVNKDSSLLHSVGKGAFAGSGIREAEFASLLEVLSDSVFASCDSLSQVEFCDSLVSIGSHSFYQCHSLDSMAFPDGLRQIGASAFQGCDALAEVQLPPLLTLLADSVFAQCTNLSSVTLNDSLQVIGHSSFKDCRTLSALSFPDSLHQIGASAFQGCDALAEVQLPPLLTSLADSVFAQCANLSSVTLNDSLQVIGHSSFKDCRTLSTIVFPDSLWQLGTEAFAGCESITFVAFPDSLLVVGDSAFSGCTQLANIQFNVNLNQLGDGAFQDCNMLDSVVLPDELTSIGSRAFQRCTGLRTFATNDSLRVMGDNVLEGDTNLYYVDLRRSRQLSPLSVSRDEGMMGGLPLRVLVYLPKGCDSLGINMINTVANMVTYSKGLNVNGVNLDLNSCRQGAATHLLNQYYGSDIFGQMIGEQRHDNFPLPFEERPMPVFRLQFSVNGKLCLTKYVNYGKTTSLPSSNELGYVAGVKVFTYVDEDGENHEFTDSTAVYTDLDINVTLAYAPGDANYDGVVNVQDVTATINYILGITPDVFIFENADINNDGEINVLDVTMIINTILYGGNDGSSDTKTLKVLCIGNSYTCDAFAYVPYIMQNIAPKVKLTLGLLTRGSATLQNHYEEHFDSCGRYPLYYKFKNNGIWHNYSSITIDQALENETWDIVMLQQGSTESRDYALYQPYLDSIIVSLKEKMTTPVTIGWMLIPAYPDGQELLEESSSDEMFRDIAACTDSVMTQTGIDFMIPCGTAIQNARTTSLDQLGDFGHLSYEGRHLQDGIPCLIEAYTVTQVLLDKLGVQSLIDDDFLNVTDSWIMQNHTPQENGSAVGMTPTNRELAKYCAKMAMRSPYEITDCSGFLEWLNEKKRNENR